MQIKTITKGNLLIAQPALYDFTFNRSVVLISDHNDKGSVGFILNKPLNQTVNFYVSDLDCDFEVYSGGPVETENLYYVHSRPDLIGGSEHIIHNLYWSGNYEDVKAALLDKSITQNEIRFYLGYSGWGEDQLKAEIEDKAWIVIDDNLDIFKNWDNNLWKQEMQRLGGEHLLWINTPADPSMN